MTLARKIYKLMEIGKDYHISELVELLYQAEREYMSSDYDIEEALEEEWLAAVHSSYAVLTQKIREALKVTRQFGYTTVNVTVTEAHDKVVTAYRTGRYGIRHSYKKNLHYGEFKDYTYRRIK